MRPGGAPDWDETLARALPATAAGEKETAVWPVPPALRQGTRPAAGTGSPAARVAAAEAEGCRAARGRVTASAAAWGLASAAVIVALAALAGRYDMSEGLLAVGAWAACWLRLSALVSRRRRLSAVIARLELRPAPWPAGAPPAPGHGAEPQAPLFTQRFCSVAPASPGESPRGPGFTVRVSGGWLLIAGAPAQPLFQVPAWHVEIATPRQQRRTGCGSIMRIGGELWSVDFGEVFRAEAAESGPARGLAARLAFGAPRRSARLARELNARFTAAMLAAGAAEVPARQALPGTRP